jgi:hypothetical protein
LPFVLKRETVVLTEAMTNRPEYTLALSAFPPTALTGGAASEKKPTRQARLAVLQAHGDVVVSLPNGAVLLAHSETAPCEMFALGEDVLAVQGHPELDGATMLEKIAPFARALSEDDRAVAKSSLRLETDHVSVVGIVRAFLRGFSSSDDGDRRYEKIIEKDTLESLRRHTEAARAALADAPPRGKDGLFSRPDATAEAKAGYASSAASGAAALSAGAASVTSTPNTSLSPLSESSKNANARLAERQLVVAAEDAFACAARGAEAEVRAMSFEFATLAKVNRAAAEKYAELGCTVAGLGVFADSLRRKDANAAPRFAELDVIEQNLDALENAAAALEAEAERLATRAAAVRLLAAKRKTLSLDEKVGLLESGGGGSNEA